jgi:hypothetical protein
MKDLIASLRLDDLMLFLHSGHPPILYQLFGLNILLMLIFLVRRIRKQPGQKRNTAITIQWIIIFGITGVLMEQEWLPYVENSPSVIMQRYQDVTSP